MYLLILTSVTRGAELGSSGLGPNCNLSNEVMHQLTMRNEMRPRRYNVQRGPSAETHCAVYVDIGEEAAAACPSSPVVRGRQCCHRVVKTSRARAVERRVKRRCGRVRDQKVIRDSAANERFIRNRTETEYTPLRGSPALTPLTDTRVTACGNRMLDLP